MYPQTMAASPDKPKMFLDIPAAAEMAGFSIRHFRRIIEENSIPTMQIGRKFFILGRDFKTWKSTKGRQKISRSKFVALPTVIAGMQNGGKR